MKSISVRDLRHHWPEAERALLSEREIIITRDAKPIAKLIPWNGKRARADIARPQISSEEPNSFRAFCPPCENSLRSWVAALLKRALGALG